MLLEKLQRFILSRPKNRTFQGADNKWPLKYSASETSGFSLRSFIFTQKMLKQLHKIEGHLGFKEGCLLFKLVKSLKEDSVILEIGAFLGKSTCFIAEAIGPRTMQFYTIDTWYNDKMERGRADVYADFLRNTRPYQDKLTPLRGYSYELVKNWPPQRKIDFLFLDGDHSYEGTRRDIQDWLPLVRKGGLVCFHDYRDFPGVIRAVDEAAGAGKIRRMRVRNSIYVAPSTK